MADDDRPDARDPEVGAWLDVEALDDVTRRRLVTTALRESAPPEVAPRPSRAWRWIAAAAAVVVVAIGTLAVVTAEGGNDEQQATRTERSSVDAGAAAPKAASAPVVVGDFGDLDRADNLERLRRALTSSEPSDGSAVSHSEAQSTAGAFDDRGATPPLTSSCRGELPAGTVVAEGTGTLDGRQALVVLTLVGDGTHSLDAVLADPCEVRHLP